MAGAGRRASARDRSHAPSWLRPAPRSLSSRRSWEEFAKLPQAPFFGSARHTPCQVQGSPTSQARGSPRIGRIKPSRPSQWPCTPYPCAPVPALPGGLVRCQTDGMGQSLRRFAAVVRVEGNPGPRFSAGCLPTATAMPTECGCYVFRSLSRAADQGLPCTPSRSMPWSSSPTIRFYCLTSAVPLDSSDVFCRRHPKPGP